MKILGGELEPSVGHVKVDTGERLGKLRQDQFAFEKFTVIDTVIMGFEELWAIKQERDRIYSLAEMSEDDGMKVAELEVEFAELDGYSAEARAGELLLGLGIPESQHFGPMSEVAPAGSCAFCWRRHCLATPISCCSTSPPTTWISTPSAGWKRR
jgi:ATPase subunit of ABC transporter with duplicated ATPase domains